MSPEIDARGEVRRSFAQKTTMSTEEVDWSPHAKTQEKGKKLEGEERGLPKKKRVLRCSGGKGCLVSIVSAGKEKDTKLFPQEKKKTSGAGKSAYKGKRRGSGSKL